MPAAAVFCLQLLLLLHYQIIQSPLQCTAMHLIMHGTAWLVCLLCHPGMR